MAFDSSDSDQNLIKNYEPKVELPDQIPSSKNFTHDTKKDHQIDNSLSPKNKSKSQELFREDSSSSDEFDFDLYVSKRKKIDKDSSNRRRSRKNHRKDEKDTFNFKPAPSMQDRLKNLHPSDDDDFEKLHAQEVSPDDLPDVIIDDNIEEEEEDMPLVNADWKSKNQNITPIERIQSNAVEDPPRVKKPNPRISIALKRKPIPPSMNESTSSPDFNIVPPSGTRRPRPIPKKKQKQITEENEIHYEDKAPEIKEEKIKQSDSSNTNHEQSIDIQKWSKKQKQFQESMKKKIHEAISQAQQDQHHKHQVQQTSSKPQIITLTFTEFICSVDSQGSINKRTYVKIFENATPLYSLKFKNSLNDGNINVSVGANAHISKGSHFATIIVANAKSDFSLRQGTFEGPELVTVRTTLNQNDGKSGHAIFIHNFKNYGPIDLIGYWSNISCLEFREKSSNAVFAIFNFLSSTTINAKCCEVIDSLRCLAICFALFMSRKN